MADFPHQRLVPVDDRLRGGAIVVEAGRRHRLLDLANRRFAFGDLALQSGGPDNTFPSDAPVERIDYIFGTGVVASQGRVVASTASDHRAVIVTVTLNAR